MHVVVLERNIWQAVLDKDFKVCGISNLRVVDASVFSKPPSSNINAPTLAIAMLAAEKIKQEHQTMIVRRRDGRRGLRSVGEQVASHVTDQRLSMTRPETEKRCRS